MKTIKIGKERELLFNLWAIKELKKRYGSLESMATITDKDDVSDSYDEITEIITILINAGIRKRNDEVRMGYEKGSVDELLTSDIVIDYLDINTLKTFPRIFGEIMAAGYSADIPNDKNREEDEVLKEIDAKNA